MLREIFSQELCVPDSPSLSRPPPIPKIRCRTGSPPADIFRQSAKDVTETLLCLMLRLQLVSGLPISQQGLLSKVALEQTLPDAYRTWTCESIVPFQTWTLMYLLNLGWIIHRPVFNRTASIQISSFRIRHMMLQSPHHQISTVLLQTGYHLRYRIRPQSRLLRSQKLPDYAPYRRPHLPHPPKSQGRLLRYLRRFGGTTKKSPVTTLTTPPMMDMVSTALDSYLHQQSRTLGRNGERSRSQSGRIEKRGRPGKRGAIGGGGETWSLVDPRAVALIMGTAPTTAGRSDFWRSRHRMKALSRAWHWLRRVWGLAYPNIQCPSV